MCGIFFSCSRNVHQIPREKLFDVLSKRGPDGIGTRSRPVTFQPTTSTEAVELSKQSNVLTFASTVLSLRGDSIVDQPLEDSKSGSLLCWNGEAWKINNAIVEGNDAKVVFNLLLKATQSCNTGTKTKSDLFDQRLQNVLTVVGSITGPYAFVFYDAQRHRVFYGRDVLGRRSLVVKSYGTEGLAISSVADTSEADGWNEVETNGIYMLDLQGDVGTSAQIVDKVIRVPWTIGEQQPRLPYHLTYPFPTLNKDDVNALDQILTLDSPAVSHLYKHLQASLSIRTRNIPTPPSTEVNPTRLAILFSGGLDCTVLACVMHNILPKEQDVDLLNVAFENPRVVQAATVRTAQTTQAASSAYALCPDRITGLSSHAELLKLCPGRTWRFVAIDIPYTETQAHRSQMISLIHPHNTEMDLSIACALYFAARGSGTTIDPLTSLRIPYTTPARVLLSGLGADELFGGYTRHATAFARRGYGGLADELELDFNRLGKRNLGRDDRVISHWGKEVRYPYLDEELVRWALRIPVWEKCGFGQRDGREDEHVPALEPGKKVLRLLAWKLGLRGAAMEKKRAIQFGARTAKMEVGRTKGTQILA